MEAIKKMSGKKQGSSSLKKKMSRNIKVNKKKNIIEAKRGRE